MRACQQKIFRLEVPEMAQAGQELEAKRVIDHTAIVKSEKNPRHKPSVNNKVDVKIRVG